MDAPSLSSRDLVAGEENIGGKVGL